MGDVEGTTVTLLLGRWEFMFNRRMGWREWQRTDYFIVGLAVEPHA